MSALASKRVISRRCGVLCLPAALVVLGLSACEASSLQPVPVPSAVTVSDEPSALDLQPPGLGSTVPSPSGPACSQLNVLLMQADEAHRSANQLATQANAILNGQGEGESYYGAYAAAQSALQRWHQLQDDADTLQREC